MIAFMNRLVNGYLLALWLGFDQLKGGIMLSLDLVQWIMSQPGKAIGHLTFDFLDSYI